MKWSLSHFFYTLFFLLMGFCVHSQKKTELALDKEGIKIYLTKFDTTAFREYRAVMTVHANIDTVVKQLIDVKRLQKWNNKNKHSELVKKVSDTSWVFYIVHHLGWPIQERDNVSRVTLINKGNEQYITMTPDNKLLKEKEGRIRLTNFKGYWYLKRIDDKQTLVVQQVYGDPGGTIPAFMVNAVVTKGPYDSFKALRRHVENLNKK